MSPALSSVTAERVRPDAFQGESLRDRRRCRSRDLSLLCFLDTRGDAEAFPRSDAFFFFFFFGFFVDSSSSTSLCSRIGEGLVRLDGERGRLVGMAAAAPPESGSARLPNGAVAAAAIALRAALLLNNRSFKSSAVKAIFSSLPGVVGTSVATATG